MTLIKSISGIRGTIGGQVGENLTPIDAVKFASAYGIWLKQQRNKENFRVVVGRDARISGEMIQNLVMNTLVGLCALPIWNSCYRLRVINNTNSRSCCANGACRWWYYTYCKSQS